MSLHYEKSDGIAVLTLDNPPVNVFTPPLHKELYDHLRDFVADPDVRVGILAAAGERAFCAGDDIKSARPDRTLAETVGRHFAERREDEPLEYPGWESEILRMQRYKPIVAAVNGVCLGQGLVYLLMLTDIRLATPDARFGFPEIAYGMGGAGGATRLGQQIPHTVAMWLALTGEPLDAQDALRFNLINEIVEPGRLQARAHEVARMIARHPPLAVRVEMEAYYRGLDLSRQDALAAAGHLYRLQRAAMDPTPPLAKSAAARES
jgi:enoyl-CoA hydratase/carnithine racemase